MPLPWLWTHDLVSLAYGLGQAEPAVNRKQYGDELVVEYKHIQATFNPQVFRFTGGVRATYGETTVFADELVLYFDQDERHGEASGHVKLDDPEGHAEAARIEFSWKDKTATAYEVKAQVEGVRVNARKIDVKPGLWELSDFSGTNSSDRPPVYLISSKHGTIMPGKKAVVEKPALYLFGSHVANLPKYTANLDRRASGIRLPSISYRRDRGIGLGWNASLLVSEQLAFAGTFDVFHNYSPSYGFQLSHSFVGPEKSNQLVIPRSELDERFSSSYFENITVDSPNNDELDTRAPRSSLSVGTFRNAYPADRDTSARYNKPIDVAFEHSGAQDRFGYYTQLRLQNIQRIEDKRYTRALWSGTLDALPTRIGKGAELHWRADASTFFGPTAFGWVRGEAGVSVHPHPFLTLGLSAFTGFQGGNSLFPADELAVRTGYTLRGDLAVGPRRFSYLNRYDLLNHGLFDHEFSFSQVMGPVEAYIVYRQLPGDYHYGIRLRLDAFLAAIQRRNVQRTKGTSNSIQP